jgi:hypothetical protein
MKESLQSRLGPPTKQNISKKTPSSSLASTKHKTFKKRNNKRLFNNEQKDLDSKWQHDKFKDVKESVQSRLGGLVTIHNPVPLRKHVSIKERMEEIGPSVSILGRGNKGPCGIQITNLHPAATEEDVQVISRL